MFRKKNFYLLVFVLLALTGGLMIWCDKTITEAAADKLYSDIEKVPYNKTGLVLGTAKYLAGFNGGNPYYNYRIEAAVKLWKAGKIKYLVISGDNRTLNYNEPEMMRKDLLKAGVDSAAIYMDYAGFRTFDSVKRLKEVFGQDSVTIISQQFHNERALYIAGHEGIAAIGFNARDVSKPFGFRIQVREKFARVKVFADYLFGKEPRFLGPKIVIP